jgi:hypothetical protein
MTGIVAYKTYQSGSAISCFGKMDGEATVKIEGGCLPYTYCWNTNPVQRTKTASNLGAGTYTVNVKDANGQSLSLSVNLTQPSPLLANAGIDAMIYNGYGPYACTSLKAIASGGNANYQFAWSNGIEADITSVCPSISTTYHLKVSDANGCEAQDQVYVCVADVQCAKGGNAMDTAGQKVMICHKAGNKYQTLCVARGSVQAHLAHGDKLGDCNMTNDCLNMPHNTSRKTEHENVDTDKENEQNRQDLEGEVSATNQITAQPNPFTALTNLHFTALSNECTSVAIVNMKGELISTVFQQKTEANKTYSITLDATSWPDGIYLASITSANQMQYLKLVVKH